jgi:hypothetical protein
MVSQVYKCEITLRSIYWNGLNDCICVAFLFSLAMNFMKFLVTDRIIYYAGSEETSEPKPVPSLLVGYENEWLTVSPNSVRYWVCTFFFIAVACLGSA